MTEREVIAAIRANHLKANIAEFERDPEVTVHWDRATVDPGGSLFGGGPYLKVPISGGEWDGTVHRVYPPARLRRRLARDWGAQASARTASRHSTQGHEGGRG